MSALSRALRPRIVAAFCALLAPAWLAAAPLDVVRNCADTASAGLSGIKALGAVCPQLADAISSLGLDDVLLDGWQDNLSVFTLRDLTGFAQRYQGPKWHISPSTATLPEILATLQREQDPKLASLWDSLSDWWKRWLARKDSVLARWVSHWLDDWMALTLSMTWVKWVVYGLGVLSVLGAMVVVLRELMAAGVLRRRPAEASTPLGRVAGASAAVESAPLSDTNSPAELLRLLVRRLLQTGRLKAAASLTHRELIVRSAFDSESQRAAFAGVAWTAESILYGPRGAPQERLTSVIEEGRTLLAQLSDSSSAI